MVSGSFIQLGLLWVFSLTATSAFQHGSNFDVDGLATSQEDSIYVNTPALADDIKNALSIIRSVETMPSCNKMAASSLLHECATLDSPIQHKDRLLGPDSLLDSSKQLYAARLAVCELHDAQVHVPEACKSFLPTRKSAKRRMFKWRIAHDDDAAAYETYPFYEELTSQDLNDCLSALHCDGSGQGWTSFSNNKKHAVAMCHAVRGDIEKDSHINLFKVLANSTIGITEALGRSNSEWHELITRFEELKSSMQQFHVDLHQDSIAKQQEVAQAWLKMKSVLQQDLEQVSQMVNDMRGNVVEAGQALGKHEHLVQQAFDRTSTQIDSLATHSTQILSAAADQTSSLRDAMSWLHELVQHSITKVIYNTTQNVEHANAVATANLHITEQLFSQSERAAQLVASIEQAAIRIQEISIMTVEQAEQANNSVMKMTAAVSGVADMLQSTFGGIMPHFHNAFWVLLFFLFALSGWRMIVNDGTSVFSLSLGTSLVLTYMVRVQDAFKGASLETTTPLLIPLALVLAIALAVLARYLLSKSRQDIAPSHSTTLPTTERQHYFHHPINDPKSFSKMVKR